MYKPEGLQFDSPEKRHDVLNPGGVEQYYPRKYLL
jgi:hypothetical protein